ncbi:MAG TPA: response regulator transcription factor [Rubricoccaceae bacterium]|nr:response regulator transcription factor [Rubricoccaceae bacterium]
MEHPPEDISVWVVEDHALYRQSTAAVLDAADGVTCPVAVASCEEALDALDREAPPDLVLMDIGLPGMSGIEGAHRLRARVPTARVVMLTVHEEDAKVFDAICAGASGYLLKPSSPERIVEAVREVQAGAAPINGYIAGRVLGMFTRLVGPQADYGLTPREKEMLELMVEGLTMKESADRLCVSYHTVDKHVRSVYEKLHVHSRGGAVAKALRERLV